MIRTKQIVRVPVLTALAVVCGILSVAALPQGTSSGGIGRIVRLDPRFDPLVPPGAVLEKIADGLNWGEGPLWNHAEGYLLFSDIPQNAVYRWEPDKGLHLFLKPSGYSEAAPFAGRKPGSNGLAFDHQGRLVLAERRRRRGRSGGDRHDLRQ
jgi:gluconolactonase